jgi:hypothetical protein
MLGHQVIFDFQVSNMTLSDGIVKKKSVRYALLKSGMA